MLNYRTQIFVYAKQIRTCVNMKAQNLVDENLKIDVYI